MSPTARTLAELRKQGFEAAVVESWNHITKTRRDLFGHLDLLAIRPGETLGVQATSGSNVAARVKKIQAEPRAVVWLKAGNRLEVWGWRKLAKPVNRKSWTCRVVRLELRDGEICQTE